MIPLAGSRRSDTNPRTLDPETCAWERTALDDRTGWEIGIGRTADGWHATGHYWHAAGRTDGPIFIRPVPFRNADSARQTALNELRQALTISYDHASARHRARLLRVIEQAMEPMQMELFG